MCSFNVNKTRFSLFGLCTHVSLVLIGFCFIKLLEKNTPTTEKRSSFQILHTRYTLYETQSFTMLAAQLFFVCCCFVFSPVFCISTGFVHLTFAIGARSRWTCPFELSLNSAPDTQLFHMLWQYSSNVCSQPIRIRGPFFLGTSQ